MVRGQISPPFGPGMLLRPPTRAVEHRWAPVNLRPALLLYNDFDIILGPFPACHELFTALHAPCDVSY